MKLFYTGALSNGEPQRDGRRSLGGYISSTEVDGAALSSVFADISRGYEVERETNTYCFALYNEEEDKARVHISAHVVAVGGGVILADENTKGVLSSVFIGMEEAKKRPIAGLKGDVPYSFGSITRATSQPSVSFSVFTDTSPLTLDVEAGMYVGLWVMRKVNRDALASRYNEDQMFFAHMQEDRHIRDEDESELRSRYPDGFPSVAEEEIRLNVKYDEV